jgi:hypothetical protein
MLNELKELFESLPKELHRNVKKLTIEWKQKTTSMEGHITMPNVIIEYKEEKEST